MHLKRTAIAAAGSALALGLAVPAVASVTPRTGRYAPICPQGWHSGCGESGWNVSNGGTRIDKLAIVPWPNDPKKPSQGICVRGNPFTTKPLKVVGGKFSFNGRTAGHNFTWTGHWVTRGKLQGTVKWAGCPTLVKYTAVRYP